MQNFKPLIWSATIALAMLSLFLIADINHTLETAATTNTISFSGEGKVLAKPDVAVIDFSIVTEATTSKSAQDQNSARSKVLTDFIAKAGIAAKDIKTTSYNIYPQYTYRNNQKPEITGYQVSQSFQVKVRDLTKTDTILDGIVSAGVNQVSNLQLQIDEPEKLKDSARQMAINDAKEKAKNLEKQLGVHLGRIVNFSEGGYVPPIYMLKAEDGRGGMGGGVPGPSVPTGENEININVTVTYQIK